jgi:FtsZ-binding cell division protein ZapB
MAVDNNFERLEEKLNNLVEALTQLRQDNTEMENRIAALQRENDELKNANGRLNQESERLQQLEREHRDVLDNREVVKGRIDNILAKLDEVEL